MTRVGAYDAKTHLAQLLDAVEKGETITITRRGVDVARLVPADDHAQRRQVREAIARIRERRKAAAMTADEIVEARNEGRKPRK